jgi:hypothetical protein
MFLSQKKYWTYHGRPRWNFALRLATVSGEICGFCESAVVVIAGRERHEQECEQRHAQQERDHVQQTLENKSPHLKYFGNVAKNLRSREEFQATDGHR